MVVYAVCSLAQLAMKTVSSSCEVLCLGESSAKVICYLSETAPFYCILCMGGGSQAA
jgi:hypothetical protein